MRFIAAAVLLLTCTIPLWAQESSGGPTDEKAKKTYREAVDWVHKRNLPAAIDAFKKADKQDGCHCIACLQNIVKFGIELQDWKAAETAAQEIVARSGGDGLARAHYFLAIVLMDEAGARHKDEYYSRAHEELTKALAVNPNFPQAVFQDGRMLAHLKQDDAAKAQFGRFVSMRSEDDPDRQRALRYISQPELARARMAPPFAITTIDGQRVSLDDLKGKVVLLDFWATWCVPCQQALPHMKKIAKMFDGQPFVMLSISVDQDEQKWRDFVQKNGMTWLQYSDGGFDGRVAKLFSVQAIPHTFTIDPDGVLQDEQIGDASIEGKPKKLITRARQLQSGEKASAQ